MPQGLALRASNLLGSRAADTRPSSWREEDLSIELVAATENPTRMRVWEYDQEVYSYRSREFDEILDVSGMSQSDIDAFVGCPVLDSHSTWSTMEIVGVVDEARREGTELIVRIRLSKTEEDLVSKVRDGIVRKTSLGYQRRTGAVTQEREGDVPLRRQPFTPCEVSFVAVPADAGCGTRSLGSVAALARRSAPVSEPSSQDQTNMNVEAIRSAAAGLATSVAALQTALGVTTPTTATDDAARSAIEGATRSAPAPVVEPAAPAPAPAPAQRAVSDEVAARATAVAGLRSAAVAVGADMTVFDGLAAGGEPLEGLRSLIKAKGPKTSDTEVNATRGASQEDLQGQPQFVGFDQAVSAQRGADQSDISKLAAVIAAGLGSR